MIFQCSKRARSFLFWLFKEDFSTFWSIFLPIPIYPFPLVEQRSTSKSSGLYLSRSDKVVIPNFLLVSPSFFPSLSPSISPRSSPSTGHRSKSSVGPPTWRPTQAPHSFSWRFSMLGGMQSFAFRFSGNPLAGRGNEFEDQRERSRRGLRFLVQGI